MFFWKKTVIQNKNTVFWKIKKENFLEHILYIFFWKKKKTLKNIFEKKF